ncbi:ATP-binding protein [Agathobaculum sp. LCP25S3_E8]|uniref:ATP-binding protein n=1 Tax=Agathobaculum sp. LCP25S3_E8 TaxID=3438735 RepID=UPI003F9295DF
MKELCVPAKLEQLDSVLSFVDSELHQAGCEETVKTQIMVAVEEIFTNISQYAYPKQEGRVTVQLQIIESPAIAQIEIIDQGVPYDPLERQDPNITLSVEKRDIGGLGIFMVKQMMDEVSYRYENKSNILTIRKALSE